MGLQWIGRALHFLEKIPVVGDIVKPFTAAGRTLSEDINSGYEDPYRSGSSGGSGGSPPGYGNWVEIASGIWAQRQQDKANDENWRRYLESIQLQKDNKGVDFAQLVRDAQAAGFNPLTALSATGGAGYSLNIGPPPLSMPETGIPDALQLVGANLQDLETQRRQHEYALDEMRQSFGMQAAALAGVPALQSGYSASAPVSTAETLSGDPQRDAALSLPVKRGFTRVWSKADGMAIQLPDSDAVKYGLKAGDVYDLTMASDSQGQVMSEIAGVAHWRPDSFHVGWDREGPHIGFGPMPKKVTPMLDPGTVQASTWLGGSW